jgi:hypothetical protein
MLRLFTVAGFALAVATSAQGISPAPLSSAIRHNQPSSLGMRPRSDASCGCLRGKNQHRHTRRAVRRDYRRGY